MLLFELRFKLSPPPFLMSKIPTLTSPNLRGGKKHLKLLVKVALVPFGLSISVWLVCLCMSVRVCLCQSVSISVFLYLSESA